MRRFLAPVADMGIAKALVRKVLLSLVAGMGVGLAIGTTMWIRAAASSPPAAVHECFNNTSKAVTYSSTGTCSTGTTAIAPLAQQSGLVTLNTEVTTLQTQVSSLQSLLKGVSRTTVSGYPTLRFSGMNLQLLNGSGSESTLNGLGNLIVGYANNGPSYARTGSHNLITGDNGGWTSYGGLLAGDFNRITGPLASVSGGSGNLASGSDAWVGGGNFNTASGPAASVSGGLSNTASGSYASVSGGSGNTASDALEAIFGPITSDGSTLTVTGNGANSSSSLTTALFNGVNVQVENGSGSESTLNGLGNLIVGYADNDLSYARTGSHNLITGDNGGWTSYGGLLAGYFNQISGNYPSVSGGESNTASGAIATVSGGKSNTASGAWDAILGGYNNSVAVNCGYFPGSPTTSNC